MVLKKVNVMWFELNSRQSKVYPNILIEDVTLKSVDKQKYLGVTFDSKNMSYYLYLINSHKHCLSTNLLKLSVKSLVLSQLYYALPVWGPPLNQQLLQWLECMQNRAVRLYKHLSKFDHLSKRHHQLKWLPLRNLIEQELNKNLKRE